VARILLVDDDRQLLAAVGHRLMGMGYEVRAETNGEAALEFMLRYSVDAAILDVMIPGISGFELCRRIRQEPRLFGVEVIFLSGMTAEEEIEHGLAQGADDYITKPFHLDDLVRRVERLLATGGAQHLTDELTDLPGSKCIKLEIQKRIYQRQPFDIVYSQVLHLNDVAKLGNGVRERAVRHFARALQKCADKVGSEIFCAGHMGGGHYVCLVEQDKSKVFCATVRKFWEQYQEHFFAGAGLDKVYEQAIARPDPDAGYMLMDTLICATSHHPGSKESAQDLLEVLSHIRAWALEQARKGIVFDRRNQAAAEADQGEEVSVPGPAGAPA
jgi:DNA-binding response OmpR family regulator